MKVFRYKYEITVSFTFIIISFVITTTAVRFSSECTGKWTQGQLIPYTFAPNPFQNPFVQSGAARWTRGRGQGAAADALASDRYIDANMREIYIVLVLDTIVARRYTAPRHSCPSGYAQGFSASSTTCKTLLHAQRILQRLQGVYAISHNTPAWQLKNKCDSHLILEIPNHRYIYHLIKLKQSFSLKEATLFTCWGTKNILKITVYQLCAITRYVSIQKTDYGPICPCKRTVNQEYN